MALTYTPDPSIGKDCPEFSLPATDGKTYSRSDLKTGKANLVMFVCNHCPYVLAVEDRLIALGNHFKTQPVNIFAISANDAVNYPADSFEKMKERSVTKSYPYPYLYDESQAVAKSFGAVCTPDFFLYDSQLKLVYRGRLDDNWKDATLVKTEELKAAIQALIDGSKVREEQRPSMGCSIKWKKENL